MRNDLLKVLEGHNDLTNVIVLTFNIDLLFIETVLLRSLKRCGHPSLTVFADAEEVSRTFHDQVPWLASIGRRFRVVPVMMGDGYRFHPKAVLLSGPKSAELLIGSGNLTFGGFRQNDEIWTSFSPGEDGTAPLAAFRQMLDACLSRCPDAQKAHREVAEAFDQTTHPWASTMEEAGGVLWRIGEGASLLDAVGAAASGFAVNRVVVCAPYFDKRGKALRALAQRWPDAKVEVLVQTNKSQLAQSTVDASGVPLSLLTMTSGREGERTPFVHGKFYALINDDEVLLFAGSANCSAAALTATGSRGNAEALAMRRMTPAEFEEEVLSGLDVSAGIPKLPETYPDGVAAPNAPSLQILNACYENGELRISFKSSCSAHIETCLTDSEAFTVKNGDASDDVLVVTASQYPKWVSLEGVCGDERVASRRHWVNHEFDLSATSRQRKVAQKLDANVSPTTWSLRSWVEIMRLLGDHLKYEVGHQQGSKPPSSRKKVAKTYDPEQFFTEDYRLPSRRWPPVLGHEDERVLGLQRLLLGYFGFDAESAPAGSDEDQEEQIGIDDEAVDQPERIPGRQEKQPPRKNLSNPTDAERKRARQIAKKVVEQVISGDYVLRRHPEALGKDLTIVAVLLIAGYCEGWLSSDEFFELTCVAWTHLFFDADKEPTPHASPKGLLDLRLETTDDRLAFCEAMSSVPLSAALALWSFVCPPTTPKIDRVRFALATRLAVKQLPWLWSLNQLDDVAEEIDRIAARTGWFNEDAAKRFGGIHEEWGRLQAEGRALFLLGKAMAKRPLDDWRSMLRVDRVEPGDILWQGTLGFGIATASASRSSEGSFENVLFFRVKKMERKICAAYLLPVAGLAATVAAAGDGMFSNKDLNDLMQFLRRLSEVA